jgi:hypothetical protein
VIASTCSTLFACRERAISSDPGSGGCLFIDIGIIVSGKSRDLVLKAARTCARHRCLAQSRSERIFEYDAVPREPEAIGGVPCRGAAHGATPFCAGASATGSTGSVSIASLASIFHRPGSASLSRGALPNVTTLGKSRIRKKWMHATPALDSAHPRWHYWLALRHPRYRRAQRQQSASHLRKCLHRRNADVGL